MPAAYVRLVREQRGLLWFLKSKPYISFIGIDGSGKTTISQSVKARLEADGFTVAVSYGGRGKDNFLPIGLIRKITRRGKKSRGSDQKSKKERLKKEEKEFRFRYMVSTSLLTLDMLMRYIFRILPLRKMCHFVIVDRDATDILLIEHLPLSIKKFLFSLVPRPTKTIYLYSDISVLSQRKRYHPVEDFERQKALYSEILPFLKPVMIKSEDIGKTTERVISELFR